MNTLTPEQLQANTIKNNLANYGAPSTVSLSALNSATPINVPPTTNDATSLNSLVASLGEQTTQATTDLNTAQNDTNATTNEITKLLASLGGQTADQNAAESLTGLPTLNKDLIDLQNTARQQQIEYATTPYSLQGQGRGITTGILRGQEAVKQRQVGIDLLLTNSNIQAKQGNIALAQNLADKAVAAKYDPIKQEIEAKKFILDQKSKNLTSAETKLTNIQKDKLNLQLKQIEKKETEDTLTQSMLMEASSMKAPNSIIDSANKIIKNGGTPAQVAQALGKYTGASAKASLLDEQIKAAKASTAQSYASIAKTNADIAKTKADTAKTVSETVGTTLSPEATKKSLEQFPFLKNTAQKAIDLSYASGRSNIMEIGRKVFTSATEKEQLKGLGDTLRTNMLVLNADPNIKKFFGPQMTENDVRMMTAQGTTLNPDLQTPEQFKEEANRVLDLFSRAEKSVLDGTKEGKYIDNIVIPSINKSGNSLQPDPNAYANSLLGK